MTNTNHIGFIGLGVMGQSMARNLLNAGYRLTVHTRTAHKADSLLASGAAWAESPAIVAEHADIILTIVGYPDDVSQVYLGPGGLLESARTGSLLIDMTTSRPSLAKEIAEKASSKGLQVLDAPVSGGDIGARNGTLSIMVGGNPTAFEQARPILEVLGKTIVLQGPAGSGQHTKMCNQITIASTMIGIMEALIYAKKSGLDPATVLSSISTGAAGSWGMSNLLPRVIQDDFAPGFFIHHFLKDIRIAQEEAKDMDLTLPGLDLAETLYEECVQTGLGDLGTQALYSLYARQL
jgi:3-hydroxyisobutyrate dehydrogenase